jgi:hypothetical protein
VPHEGRHHVPPRPPQHRPRNGTPEPDDAHLARAVDVHQLPRARDMLAATAGTLTLTALVGLGIWKLAELIARAL